MQTHITASINKRRWAVVKADRDIRWRELELDKGSFDHCLFVSDVIFSGVAVFAGRNKAFFSSLFVCSVLFWRRDKTTWDEMRPLVWGRYWTYMNVYQLTIIWAISALFTFPSSAEPLTYRWYDTGLRNSAKMPVSEIQPSLINSSKRLSRLQQPAKWQDKPKPAQTTPVASYTLIVHPSRSSEGRAWNLHRNQITISLHLMTVRL